MAGGVSRRDFLKLGGAAGAALVAGSACKDLASGFVSTSTAGPNTLVLSKGPDDTGTLAKVIAKFNKEDHPFKVKWEVTPADTGQYFDKMRTQFQVGSTTIDVIGADVIWPAQMAANGWIEDLSDLFTEEMRADYLESTITTSSYDNKIWGVPWYSDAGLLYYRKDLLDKAGFKPPKTWEELDDQAKKISADEGIPDGFQFQGAEYEGGVCNQCEYIWNAGGDILDPSDPTKTIIGQPEATEGHQSALTNIESGAAPLAVVTYKETESLTVFISGEAVFLRYWPSGYASATGGKAAGSVLKPEWVGVAHLPTTNAGDEGFATLGGWDMCISSLSKKKEQAWEFIQWMSQPEIQKTFSIDAGYISGRKSLFEDKELLKQQPVMELGRSSFESTRPRPSINPFYSDMSLDMANSFNSTLKGDSTPEQATRLLDSKLSRIAGAAESVFGLGRSQ
jgi:multiple sugar transport system substrate-binding protein